MNPPERVCLSPPPGVLFDVTGRYELAFIVAGATICAAGVICLPLRGFRRCAGASGDLGNCGRGRGVGGGGGAGAGRGRGLSGGGGMGVGRGRAGEAGWGRCWGWGQGGGRAGWKHGRGQRRGRGRRAGGGGPGRAWAGQLRLGERGRGGGMRAASESRPNGH